MICKKCGATMPDDGIFCSRCGERNDGKKPCPKCGELIDETAVFCSHCGERLDGKKVCPQCGALNDGNFCSVCGENLNYTNEKRTPNSTIALKREIKQFRLFCVNGVNYLDSVFALLGLLLMSVFSFFVGFNVVAEVNGEKSSAEVNVYNFFAEIYDSVPENGIIVNKVMGSVFAGIILCIPACAFVFSFFKVLLNTAKGDETDLTMLIYGTLSVFVVCVFVLFSRVVYNFTITSSSEITKSSLKMNAFCYLGMILPFVMFIISSTIKFATKEGRKSISPKDIVTSFSGICIVILLIVSVAVMSCSSITMSVTMSESGLNSVVGGTFSTFLTILNDQTKTLLDGCLPIAIVGDLIYIVFALLFIGVVFTIMEFIKNEKTTANSLFFATLVETILAVGNLVCSILFSQKLKSNATGTEVQISFTASIVALVLVGISFVISIAYQFVGANDYFEKDAHYEED